MVLFAPVLVDIWKSLHGAEVENEICFRTTNMHFNLCLKTYTMPGVPSEFFGALLAL